MAAVNAHAARWKSVAHTETVRLSRAAGRVLASGLRADTDQPPFPRSTRDGYACRATEASTYKMLHVAGLTHAGQPPGGPLGKGLAWEIMTGAAVPRGADAVMMLEHVERSGDMVRLLPTRVIEPGENVVAKGAQARKGKVLLAPGAVLGPAQIALAASCGYASVDVFARPRVAILTTGDELVRVGATPGPGQIRNSNAPMLAALVTAAGAEPMVLPTAADTPRALDAALKKALKADMLLISGGVSAGKFDLVEPALERMGARFYFTGVRMQPGKPLVFGVIPAAPSQGQDRAKPFFGLPGNPISSAATFLLFATRVLGVLKGEAKPGPRFVLARLSKGTKGRGNAGLTRFFPAWCNFDPAAGEMPEVATVPWQGSGDLPAFGQSNCFVVVPEGTASLEAGAVVRVLLI